MMTKHSRVGPMKEVQDLAAAYLKADAENRRLAEAGDRTIKARIADDVAHSAGQAVLRYIRDHPAEFKGGAP